MITLAIDAGEAKARECFKNGDPDGIAKAFGYADWNAMQETALLPVFWAKALGFDDWTAAQEALILILAQPPKPVTP